MSLRNRVQSPARRAMLQTVCAAGALTALEALHADWGFAQGAPAAAVADRASAIRITKLEPRQVAGRVFLRITTNQGVTGWGEIAGLEPNTVMALAKSLSELLENENPTRIEYLWQKLYRVHRDIRGGPFMVHTLGGIDMALWDIAGKLWQTPVYRLLGGPCRDKIRMYPTEKAVKVPPFGLYEHSSNPADIDRMVNAVKDARQKVGPDGTVMFDAHSAVPPATLIQLAGTLKPYDLLFIEEPWVPGNIETCKKVRNAVDIPLATGERDRTIWGMLPYLESQVVDILQPDVCFSGGISQLKKIAALAEAYYVPLAPHNTQSYLGLSASLHLSASIPLFLIQEGYHDDNWAKAAIRHWTIDKDGYATLPDGVGLCVDIDEKMLDEIAANPKYQFKWPTMRLKDGSISDY